MRALALVPACACAWLTSARGQAPVPTQAEGPPVGANPSTARVVNQIAPGRPPLRVGLAPADDALARYTHQASARYAVFRFALIPGIPMLLLVSHGVDMQVRAQVFDQAPWAAPRIAQSLALEPRRPGLRSGRALAGARIGTSVAANWWLLVEVSGAGDGRASLFAELIEDDVPVDRRSLLAAWLGSAADSAIPTPLQRVRREQIQEIVLPGSGR